MPNKKIEINIQETELQNILEIIKEKNINIDIKKFEKYLKKTYSSLDRLKEFVGYISFDKIQINIFPKIFNDIHNVEAKDKLLTNLKHWYVYNTKPKKHTFFLNNYASNNNWSQKYNFEQEEIDWFLENYIKKVHQIFNKHFHYEYVLESKDVSFIKGKINFNDYLKNKIPNGNFFKFNCLFFEYNHKNLLNAIIKKCLKIILNKFQKLRKYNYLIKRLLIYLSDIQDEGVSEKDCDLANFHNISNELKNILEMSRIILSNSYFNSYGNLVGFSFLLHMPTVFENFVLKQLKKANIEVKGTPEYYFFQDKTITPDFVITKEKLKIPGECKYKQIKSEKDISKQDFSQLITYAYFFNSKTPIFIFPLSEGEEFQPIDLEIGYLEKNSIKILKIPFIFNVETGEPDNISMFINKIKDIVEI